MRVYVVYKVHVLQCESDANNRPERCRRWAAVGSSGARCHEASTQHLLVEIAASRLLDVVHGRCRGRSAAPADRERCLLVRWAGADAMDGAAIILCVVIGRDRASDFATIVNRGQDSND